MMLLPILDQCPIGLKDPIWVKLTHMVSKVNMRISAITSAQIRAARALLRWSAVDLARESSVGVNTIRRAEVAENGTSLTAANELAIRRALELAGVEFIDENGGGPGLRLRKRPRAKPAKP
jgi:ribosome-binding protein aMBF1 (putative translation factor)